MKKNNKKNAEEYPNKKNQKSISRRKFLRNTSIGAAGLYIVPRHVLGGVGYVAPSDKLYVAGVGVGNRPAHVLKKIGESENAEVAYLCDVDDRQAKESRERFSRAKYYNDWREMFEKERNKFDAVVVGTPDHNHATVGFQAMQMKKHVYIEKPLTHDIWEARMLGEAAERNKVVTQMGDQGTSSDGIRKLKEWYEAGIIGDVHTVHCWTDRPVWPQGIKWPDKNPSIPKGLNWDLWLGTAKKTNYQENVVPFNWRGWWDYGTGSVGDMACHLIGPVYKILDLGYPTQVTSSVSTPYEDNWAEIHNPKSGPISSASHLNFKNKKGNDIKINWMDGGMRPDRPSELKEDEPMGEPDGGNGVIFEGTKGKMMCGNYGNNPQLLPISLNDKIDVPETYERVEDGEEGHYKQWVDACIAGHGEMEVDSPFKEYAAPLTESILMANLAIRSYSFRKEIGDYESEEGLGIEKDYEYPGRGLTLKWDAENMEVTNFDEANQFVKREYREGWPELKF